MQTITTQPAYAVPCARVLSIDARNVLNGVLYAVAYKKDIDGTYAYQDVSVCLDTIHISIPRKITIEEMVIGLRQLVGAGLLIEHGVRYKLSGLLAIQYADYVASQPQPAAV